MKKYWIKDLNENQVIHAPTRMIDNRLCEKFNMLGLTWNSGHSYLDYLCWDRYKEETCYSPSKGQVSPLSYYTQEGYEILIIEQLLDFQANEYPKVMEVSDCGDIWYKRVVFMEKNGKFLAWAFAGSIEEAESEFDTCAWTFAREIDEPEEMTLEEVCKELGREIKIIK